MLRTLPPFALLALVLAACADPPQPLDVEKKNEPLSGGGDDGGEKASTTPSTSAAAAPAQAQAQAPAPKADAPLAAPPPSVLSVTFKGKNGDRVHRACSDHAVQRAHASLFDANGLALAEVGAPEKPIGIMYDGIEDVKRSVESTGEIKLPVNPADLRQQPTLYAIVAAGRYFGDPSQCAYHVSPPPDGDAEKFPQDCGIIGYVTAHFDAPTNTIIATPESQLVWAGNPKVDKGGDGFGTPAGGSGCDDFDSPLVLDLGGRGVTLGEPKDGVFDIDGDGTADRLAWVTSEATPFLVRDANHDGIVGGIDELFGSRTSENGFEALAAWDANGDGLIDARDPVWADLGLWFDRNHDGRTDPGELETLTKHGIRAISVAWASANEPLVAGGALGGVIRQRGAAIATDGRAIDVVDVWFRRR